MRSSSLCKYPIIEAGVTAHKLGNFSISWNTSAQRALSLDDRIGTGSNLIERQLRWLKGRVSPAYPGETKTPGYSCSSSTSPSRTKEPERKHIYQNIYEWHFEILLFPRSKIIVAEQQKGAVYISGKLREKNRYHKRILTLNKKY